MNALVSIIIPVFNKADYLADCLDSVLNQSFTDLEVICVDDASEDQSGEILRDYANRDARLIVIDNDVNLGPAKSRNRGIETAKGRFIRFVDADDLLPQMSTEILYLKAVQDNVELVRGSLALFRDNDHSCYQQVFSVPDKIRTTLEEEEHLWIPWWHTSYLISADLIRRHHLRYPNLIRGEDPVFLASVLVNARHLSFSEQIVYLYRKYPKTSGSGGATMQHLMDTLEHAVITRHLFTTNYPECWTRGYGPFLLNDVRDLLTRYELDSDQQGMVDAELVKIWGDEAL